MAPGRAAGLKSSLDLSPEEFIFSEKLNPTLFVLHSADTSTEETIGILFEGELVPEPPPHSPVGECQDSSHCHQPQQTPNHRHASGSPGDSRRMWLDSEWATGCQPVLCAVWLFCDKGIWIWGFPDLSVDPCPATLVIASWVVTSVTEHTHLANLGLCQTHLRR